MRLQIGARERTFENRLVQGYWKNNYFQGSEFYICSKCPSYSKMFAIDTIINITSLETIYIHILHIRSRLFERLSKDVHVIK